MRAMLLMAGLLLAGCAPKAHMVPTEDPEFHALATSDAIRSACLNVELMREAGREPADYNVRLAEYGREHGLCE
jgi:hypothetical protein